MALRQFDLVDRLRCPATDDEGFRCLRPPSHEGGHVWGRCQGLDAEGHRCVLPPSHPGDHWLVWFDRPTVPGETHTVRYAGTRSSTEARADVEKRVFSAHGWLPVSRGFRPGLPWRWSPLSNWLAGVAAPRGQLTVVYEFQPQNDRSA